MAQFYDYHADDLDERELNYELEIRGVPATGAIETKRRDLRLLLKEDRKHLPDYVSNIPLEDEIPFILDTFTFLSSELQRKVTSRLRSKLISLGNRINRAPTNDIRSKNIFLEKVKLLFDSYFSLGQAQSLQPPNSVGEVESRRQTIPLNPAAIEFRTNSNYGIPNTRTTPNLSFQQPQITSSPSQVGRPNPLSTETNHGIEGAAVDQADLQQQARTTPFRNQNVQALDIDSQNQIGSLLTGELKDFIKNTIRDAVRNYVDEWASFPTPRFSSVLPNPSNDVGTSISQLNYPQPPQENQAPSLGSRFSPRLAEPQPRQVNQAQSPGNRFSPRLTDNNQRQEDTQFIHQAYPPPPPNYHNNLRIKIEKWQIYFSGEVGPRSLSVAEFIRQVSILAKANRVSEDELLQQAYIFFTGEARKWYFTYWEKFITWKHLVYYLTMSFENPNKDKAVEDEMRERKQRPNERFSAYLADMERLSQSLTRKMSEQQKLKLIFDNTKLSYRRRLALVQIKSINDLAEYCYQFDALEPSLFTNTTARVHSQNINQIDLDEFEDLSLGEVENEEVNAINASRLAFRSRGAKRDVGRNGNIPDQNQINEEKSVLINCWNCRKAGHVARDCQEQKRVYCYACGEPNVTKSNCPNQHDGEMNEKN